MSSWYRSVSEVNNQVNNQIYQEPVYNPIINLIPEPTPVKNNISTEKQVYLDFFNGIQEHVNNQELKNWFSKIINDLSGLNIDLNSNLNSNLDLDSSVNINVENKKRGVLHPVMSFEHSPPVILHLSKHKWSSIKIISSIKSLSGKLELDKGYYLIRINGVILTYQMMYELLDMDSIGTVEYVIN